MYGIIEAGKGFSVESRVACFGGYPFIKLFGHPDSDLDGVFQRYGTDALLIESSFPIERIVEIAIDKVKRLICRGLGGYGFLNCFPNLESLSLSGNLSTFLPQELKLRHLRIIGDYKHFNWLDFRGIEYLNLRGVRIRDLTGISVCSNLKCLAFGGRLLESISGVEDLKDLQSISIVDSYIDDIQALAICDKLKQINLYFLSKVHSLNVSAEMLENLRLVTCRNFSNLNINGELHNLKFFEFTDVAGVENIDFVHSAHDLEAFHQIGKGIVRSNDLSPLLSCRKLRDVLFVDRRGYSHKCDMIRRELGLEPCSGDGLTGEERRMLWYSVAEEYEKNL